MYGVICGPDTRETLSSELLCHWIALTGFNFTRSRAIPAGFMHFGFTSDAHVVNHLKCQPNRDLPSNFLILHEDITREPFGSEDHGILSKKGRRVHAPKISGFRDTRARRSSFPT